MSSTDHRRLAAIMFTDMVGFTALSQRDEKLALELLEEHRKVIRGLLPADEGREVKTIGDGFLIEFPSALDAVRAAVEIQTAFHERNVRSPSDRRVHVRIGIHVGDVVQQDGDIHGDGVNIASRLEPLAAPGGICLSDTVVVQVRNKLDVGLVKLAAPGLKNVELSMDVYRVVLPWEATGSPLVAPAEVAARKPRMRILGSLSALAILFTGLGWWLSHRAEPAAKAPSTIARVDAAPAAAATSVAVDQKSIAVLPFASMSEDKDNAFFADGIHEDILATLALVRDLRVISRTSVAQYRTTTKPMRQIAQELGVAYVLEGSVRRAGNKVRVTGQLIRASSDEHVWAKSYDRDLTDIFAIQSALATEIAGALQAAISPQEKSLIEHRPTVNLAAYDLFLKGRAGVKGLTSDVTRAQAERLLGEAVRLDPNFAAAWGWLAVAHALAVFTDDDHSPERLAKAKAAIETAVRLTPDDPAVIELLGNYYYYGYRDFKRAMEQYQRLLLIRPNSSDAYTQMGYVLRRQARWNEALASFRKALQFDPLNADTLGGLLELLAALRQYDDAIAQGRRLAELSRDDFSNIFFLSPAWLHFLARGSTREGDEWFASFKPSSNAETKLPYARRSWARFRGNWAVAVEIDRQYPYLEPFDDPPWRQDFDTVWDLVGNNELPAARTRAEKLVPRLTALREQQPDNGFIWGYLAYLHGFLGDKEQALRCGRRVVELLPESVDSSNGPGGSKVLANVRAWTGDKDGALAELARLLRTPYGENVHTARVDPGWLPLRGDPRFEALLKDPANNAPLF